MAPNLALVIEVSGFKRAIKSTAKSSQWAQSWQGKKKGKEI